MARQVDAEADDRRSALPFEQDARDLDPVEQQVVRPLQGQAFRRNPAVEGAGQRQRGDERELRRWTLAGLWLDHHAGEDVAGQRGPHPPATAAPAGLGVGTDPAFVGKVGQALGKPVVGRADRAEVGYRRCQNSALAAALAAPANGPIASMPIGEQASAATPISAALTRLFDAA